MQLSVIETMPLKPRILVVDDRDDIRKTLIRLFRREFDVTAVSNVNDAFACLKDMDFQLIISDFDMFPSKDGVWFYEQLVAMGSPLAQRFVLFTGSDVKCKVPHIVSKGDAPEVLVETVRALV